MEMVIEDMKDERQLLCRKMAEVRDEALDTKMEVLKMKFEQEEILERRRMERWWMEVRIMWERASILQWLPPILRANLRVHDLAMTDSYDHVMAAPSVNRHLRAALREIGPDGAAGIRSEQLRCKCAFQEEELSTLEANRADILNALMDPQMPEAALLLVH